MVKNITIVENILGANEQIAAQKAALDATAAEQARVAAEQAARTAEFAERETAQRA